MSTKTSKPLGINEKLNIQNSNINQFKTSKSIPETSKLQPPSNIDYSQCKIPICRSLTVPTSKIECTKRKDKLFQFKSRPHPLNLKGKESNSLMSLKTPDPSIVSTNFSEGFLQTLTPTNGEMLRKYDLRTNATELDGPQILKMVEHNSLETPKKIICNTPTDKTPELGLFDRSNSRSSSGNHFTFPLSNKSSDNSEKRDSPPTSPTFQSNILKRLSDEESGYNTLPDKIAKISKDVKTEVGNKQIIELTSKRHRSPTDRLNFIYDQKLLSEDRNSSNENNSFLNSSNDSMAAIANFKTRIDPINTSIHDNKYDILTSQHQSQLTIPNLQNSQLNLQKQSQQKLERKRERNREAAKRCRERKIQKISELEEQVQGLQKKLTLTTMERDYYKVKCNKIVEVVNHFIRQSQTEVPIPAISCIIEMQDTDDLNNLNYETVLRNSEIPQDNSTNRLSNTTSLNGSLSSSMTDIQQNELERNTEIPNNFNKTGIVQNNWLGSNIPHPVHRSTLPGYKSVIKLEAKTEISEDQIINNLVSKNRSDVLNN